MTEKRYPVHFANFICHFGESELLDYLDEIVLPAFTSPRAVRAFKDGRYFFNSVELVDLSKNLATPELAICGRFVKDMIVRSEQRWDNEKEALVAESRRLETAPSAVFVLLLSSHKLIYMLETTGAPGMESFRSTAASFLSAARRDYINSVANRAKNGRLTEREQATHAKVDESGESTRVTKARLNESIGAMTLEVVPLSNDENLRSFLQRFTRLKVATLRLLKPNSELDNDDFIEGLREKSDAAGSNSSTLTYRSAEGLNKSKVAEQLEAAAADGNSAIQLAGEDSTGRTLRGSNDEFKIVSYLEEKPVDIPNISRRMFLLFLSLRKEGLISTARAIGSDQAMLKLADHAKRVRKDEQSDT